MMTTIDIAITITKIAINIKMAILVRSFKDNLAAIISIMINKASTNVTDTKQAILQADTAYRF